jgi:hypothetical protein
VYATVPEDRIDRLAGSVEALTEPSSLSLLLLGTLNATGAPDWLIALVVRVAHAIGVLYGP